MEEFKSILDYKVDLKTFDRENLRFSQLITDISDDFMKKFNSTALQRDLEHLELLKDPPLKPVIS